MSTIVWAVTTGSYSDYRVKVLFSTKKLAEQHAEVLRGDPAGWDGDASVESFALLDRPPERIRVFYRWARIDTDGDVIAERASDSLDWEYGDVWGVPKPIMLARTYHAPAYGKDTLVEVRGSSKARVEKAYRDRIAQARAKILGVAS